MNIIRKTYCRIFQACFRIAQPILPYRKPQTLTSVTEIPTYLNAKKLKKPLIITDKTLSSLGLLNGLKDALYKANIPFVLYDDTVPNPTVSNVETARELYIKEGCDVLIGFGGGSPIDCAKAVGARIARPKKPISKMEGILSIVFPIPHLIAIPTTAGTGSETTVTTVITDDKTHRKFPISDFPLIPKAAVLDPELTKSLPPAIVATTGMDALVHAVEAYIGRSTSRKTRAMCIEAISLVFKNLEKVYSDNTDTEARRNMLKAAYLAGASFSKSYVGYCHAVAHSLGGKYNIPHGLANAVLIPHTLDIYGESAHKKLAKLAKATSLVSNDTPTSDAAKAFIRKIRQMNQNVGIPTHLPGICLSDIPTLAKDADKEANPIYPVPKLMNAKELELFYVTVMEKGSKNMQPIENLLTKQRIFFKSGTTLSVSYRIDALKRLKKAIQENEQEIADALKADLGKSSFEGYMCEIGLSLSELSYLIRLTKAYARDKTVYTPLTNFLSKSYIKSCPYGNVLIMSPWNYPFMLTIEPLAAAIAAGNTVIVKPSAYAPATSKIIAKLLDEVFPPEYVATVQGGRAENACLLEQKFDYIFFTGSQAVGKTVLEKAAQHLTPVTLELGGKSPCIIDKSANLKLAARRLVFGKYLNCGQTCVAPDYVFCHADVKNEFLSYVQAEIQKQFGFNPLGNPDYGKIINRKHFDRLLGLIDNQKTIYGGKYSIQTHKIEPTVMDNVSPEDAVMQEEIFGPIMPIMSYTDLNDVIEFVEKGAKPLALYIFATDKKVIRAITTRVRYGGGCVNDVVVHLATPHMGFGGVGESGMGAYHGKIGFDTFSHKKSILDKKNIIDLPMRYQPYKKLYGKLLRMFLK